jgi:hypothetical protein
MTQYPNTQNVPLFLSLRIGVSEFGYYLAMGAWNLVMTVYFTLPFLGISCKATL